MLCINSLFLDLSQYHFYITISSRYNFEILCEKVAAFNKFVQYS